MKKILFAFLMFVCTTPVVFGAAPRGITISGTIVNSDNEPIEYPVVSYGSGADTKGQQADLNGKFTLDVPSMDTVVTIYGMGYQSKTLKASELNGQIVALKDDKQFLEASVSTDCSTQQRTKKELHATQLEYIKSADKCVPKICATEENGKGYLLENGGTANAKCTPCKIDGAITTAVKDNVCVATSCQKQYYDPATKNGQCVSKVGEDCLSEIRDQNATVAKYNDRGNCDLKSCKDGYAVKGQSCDPQIDKACPKSTLQSVTGDKNATSGTITSFVNNEIKSCKITACANGWRVNKTTNKCDQICTPDAIKQLQNAGANETKVDGDKCVAKSCRCGYTLNQSLGQCNKWTTAEEKCEPKSAGATAGKYVCNDEKQVCTITTCDTKNYDMVGDGINAKCESKEGKSCDPQTENATGGKYVKSGDNVICQPICNGANYVPKLENGKYSCVLKSNRDGTDCTADELKGFNIPHATHGIVKEWNKTTGVVKLCDIDACDDGWLPNGTGCVEICDEKTTETLKNAGAFDVRVSNDGKTCVANSCKCEYTLRGDKCEPWTDDEKSCEPKVAGATAGLRTCDGGKESCMVTACEEPKYKLVGTDASATCQSNVGRPCDPLPDHATAGTNDDNMQCVVTACENGYDLISGQCTPKMVLSKENYQKEIGELSENAAAMHEKETSFENRMIGAAGIGMTGIGGTMLGAALSETASDAEAERAMRAYLETFRCDYGAGKNIRGGETNVELPGGNDMIALYQEYAKIANDLKIRKEALGMRPGIESEIVIDKSETGLYDDIGTGINGGAYASIARAMLYPDGPDAAMWAAQKEKTKNTLIAGAVTAGVGAVGSGIANAIVKHDNPNKSREIVGRYAKLKVSFDELGNINSKTPCSTADGTTGVGYVPNCACRDAAARFFADKGCLTCPTGQVYDKNNTCVCPSEKPVMKDDGSCETKAPDCQLSGLKKDNACECISNAHNDADVCVCDSGYHQDEKECIKDEVVSVSSALTNIISSATNILDAGNQIGQLSFDSDGLFDTGKSVLRTESEQRIKSQLQNVKQIAESNDIDLKTETDYCLVVVGKTDRVPFKKGSSMNNQILSERRARAVATVLGDVFNSNNIRTYGIAANDCPQAKYPNSNDKNCRRVDVLWLGGSCEENLSDSSVITNLGQQLAPNAIDTLTQTISGK